MSVSTHILDTARGCPAAGVAIVLERLRGDTAVEIGRGVTNADGRVSELVSGEFEVGDYRIHFATGDYFNSIGVEGFYPSAQITFTVRDAGQHFHVPLLLSPFGLSTYRGS